MREFFGAGADGLEKKFLSAVIDIETSKKEKGSWIEIRDSSLSKIFLESFADSDKKNILGSVMEDAKIIADILDSCNIPQTTALFI